MSNFRNKKEKQKVRQAIKISVGVCAVFALFLIFQVASVSDSIHSKMGKNKELTELQRKNKEADAKLAGLKASQNIKQSVQDLEMVDVSDVQYVSIENNNNVAVNR